MGRYRIDQDTSPPVMSAQLAAGRGQKMTLAVLIPRSYYDAHAPVGYIYTDDYGGKVESVELTDSTATLRAHSKIGSTTLDYARVNPNLGQECTLAAWLAALCALGSVGITYHNLNSALALSLPYMRGQAVGSLFGVLSSIAACYGIDLYHTSTASGDVIRVAQAELTTSGSLDGILTALSYNEQEAQYQRCVIVRTAPVEQHVETPVSVGRQTQPKRTTQGHPYLEAEVEYNQINRWWDNRTTTLSYEEIRALDAELTIEDPETTQDEWYKTKLAYAPYFGAWLKERIERSVNAMYKTSVSGSIYGGDTTETRGQQIDEPPSDMSTYEVYTDTTTTASYIYYGLFSTLREWGVATLDRVLDTWYLNPAPGRQPHTIEETHTSQAQNYVNLWPNIPYVFAQPTNGATTAERSDYYGWISGSYTEYKYIDYSYDAKSEVDTAHQPSPQQYPWLPAIRETVSSADTTVTDTSIPDTTTTTTQALTVSKALLDADWDDLVKPPTIDERYLDLASLDAVHIDKSSTARWFNASANPDADRQYMALGCVQNYKYTAKTSQEQITLTPGHEPGRLTARWIDNTVAPVYYNLEHGLSLNRLDTQGKTVQCTLLSSSQASFSTAEPAERGETYSITGSVWRSRATALACIPYIERQHNATCSAQLTTTLSLLPTADAMALLGTTRELRDEAAYITDVSIDYRAETVNLSAVILPAEED